MATAETDDELELEEEEEPEEEEEDEEEDEDESDIGEEEEPQRAACASGLEYLKPDRSFPRRVKVHKDERITSDRLQHTELVGILCARIKQLESGAPCLVDTKFTKGVTDARELAVLEIEHRVCPFLLHRTIHEEMVEEQDPVSKQVSVEHVTYYEEWDIQEMIIPKHTLSHSRSDQP